MTSPAARSASLSASGEKTRQRKPCIYVDGRTLRAPINGINRYIIEMVNALKRSHYDVIVLVPGAINEGNRQQITAHVVPIAGGVSGSFALWYLLVLPSALHKHRPDIFWGPSHRLPLWALGKSIALVTIHDLTYKVARETMRLKTYLADRVLVGRAVRAARHIVTDADFTKEQLQKAFSLPPQKVTTIPLAAGLAAGSLPVRSASSGEHVLFVGSLEPRKNIVRAVKAYLALPEELKEQFPLILAFSDGWKNADLMALIEANRQHIEIREKLDDAQLCDLYKRCRCLLMPSLYEGFGLPILEAHMFGKPVIAGNNSSMPEVAGEGGLLVDPGSVENIRAALETLLSDDAVHERLSDHAAANAERFSWDKSARQFVDLCDRLRAQP